MSSLHIVSTPIGNLGDITLRAVEVLRSADVVLAEDTRRTGMLLKHLGIDGPRMVSTHEHNERARMGTVVEMLREGRNVALVTDAGTPLLSDPGARIVRAVIEAEFDVVPVPGASALLSALVVSGISADRFTFFGFVPRKGGSRRELLDEIARSRHTSVLYESPQRTLDLLADLAQAAGAERRVSVARELTKLHEEVFRGTLGEAVERFTDVTIRGEIALVVAGRELDTAAEAEEQAASARVLAVALLEQGLAPSAVSKQLRDRLKISRNEAYDLVQELKMAVDPPDPEEPGAP